MKHVVHDWDDEHAIQILSNCRKAMGPGGKILVVDRVIGSPNRPDQAKLYDLAMLVSAGGRERNESEWRILFAAAELHLERTIAMPTPQSIIEATLA